jgi:nickel-dependent lactate racemase
MDNLILGRTKAWYEDKKLEYRFPYEWNVQILSHLPTRVLNQDEIYQKIQKPIGCSPLSNYLQPGMSVCIVSDDISRPTRTDIIIPILIEYLNQNRIPNESIRIVISSGTHKRMSQIEKNLKFGPDICKSIKLIDHDLKKNLFFMGKTSLGTPVYVNKTVAKSDLVIGIGGIHPHSQAGFSGGAKLILGVSGIKTILYFHDRRKRASRGTTIDNELRDDMTEAARLCKMNFIINNLISENREIVDIFAGDLEFAYTEGVKKAKYLYKVKSPNDSDADLIVADTYPFDISCSMSRKGWWPVLTKNYSNQRLIIAAIPKGINEHILFPFNQQKYSSLPNILCRRLQTHSVSEFIMLLSKKIYLKGIKKKVYPKHNGASINSTNNAPPVFFYHDLDINPNINLSNYIFFNSMADCFDQINIRVKKKHIKVWFYKASSLTYSTMK